MTQEIEMNFKVTNKKGLLAFLRRWAKEKVSEIKMTYFNRKDDDSFYIRIEEIKENDKKRMFLTAKGGFENEDGINKKKEVSIPITGNIQQYIDFLLLVGMKPDGSKQKIRHYFKIDGLEITFDEWNVEELGDRLEIEGKSKDKIKQFSQKIVRFCDPNPSR
ncbi:MAG: hypothetical protein XD98_0475 [Microgenomates bacterium 39_6]|nr:MAG: hypothetical protein XD98_0475 [Microgenomates bacterium 39_6]